MAVQKVKKALPTSLDKKVAVFTNIFHSFDETIQIRIVQNRTVRKTLSNAISAELVNELKDFYERDDISRMSPDVKGCRKFLNTVTGQQEVKPIRHMMYRLGKRILYSSPINVSS